MTVRYTLGEAQKCFGLDVAKNALLVITKCNPYTSVRAKQSVEQECQALGLKYIYFNTSYDDHIVPEADHNQQME